MLNLNKSPEESAKPAHTPLPWFLFGSGHCVGGRFFPIGNPPCTAGIAICSMAKRHADENAANAEFIVRACNAHDALLAACKESLLCISESPGARTADEIHAIRAGNAAISLAEGGAK